MKYIDIQKVKENPENPRFITDSNFRKLVKSITEFPEMLEANPVVIDENNVILGGNMRVRALKEAGIDKVPVIQIKNWTDEQKKEFIVKDNVSYGEWETETLREFWDEQKLIEWNVPIISLNDVENHVDDNNFEDNFNSIKNSDAIYPVVPYFEEHHELFIIQVDNEVDANWLRERLNMQRMKSYKNSEIAKSNVISFEDFKDAI